MTDEHVPVLADEVLRYLQIHSGGIYFDCTFGRGGHSRAILQHLAADGRLFGLDRDPLGVAAGRDLAAADPRFTMLAGEFADIATLASQQGVLGQVSGMVFDLGVSSPQLESSERGFSFARDGPLDMRMDPSRGMSAAEWLIDVSVSDLSSVFRDYGEERYAKRIARAIDTARKKQPIETTARLAEIIRVAYPHRGGRIDPATRCFQAIRIFINGELAQLHAALDNFLEVLAIGGRVVFISFHSLEDRMVKRCLRRLARDEGIPAQLPVTSAAQLPRLRIVASKVRASSDEISANPRARSAILRAAERLR
jgi:16S rRNA (cytosine1402-N4)-methyltransferase